MDLNSMLKQSIISKETIEFLENNYTPKELENFSISNLRKLFYKAPYSIFKEVAEMINHFSD